MKRQNLSQIHLDDLKQIFAGVFPGRPLIPNGKTRTSAKYLAEEIQMNLKSEEVYALLEEAGYLREDIALTEKTPTPKTPQRKARHERRADVTLKATGARSNSSAGGSSVTTFFCPICGEKHASKPLSKHLKTHSEEDRQSLLLIISRLRRKKRKRADNVRYKYVTVFQGGAPGLGKRR